MIVLELRLSNDGARALARELEDFVNFEQHRMQSADIGESALGYVAARTLQAKLDKMIQNQDARWEAADKASQAKKRLAVRRQYGE